MFQFKCRLKTISIDLNSYRSELQQILLEAISHAAFEWLNATLAVIPTWSGASRATFLHLAREINYTLPIQPKQGVQSRFSLGFNQSDGSIGLDDFGTKAFFKYETSLEHLIYNEYNDANASPDPGLFAQLLQPGPYNFQELGKDAFFRAVASTQLPDFRKHLKTATIRVS